jgi:hypothetical protein
MSFRWMGQEMHTELFIYLLTNVFICYNKTDIERIVLLDFIHRLVSQKIEE